MESCSKLGKTYHILKIILQLSIKKCVSLGSGNQAGTDYREAQAPSFK